MSISQGLFLETFYPITITTSDDGMGGHVASRTIGTAFRGRLSSIYSGEKVSDNKLTLNSSHKIFCDYMTIDETSEIVNSASTRIFKIVGIVDPSNSHHHLEIFVKEFGTNP